MEKLLRASILGLVLAFLVPQLALAQNTGTVVGMVSDDESGEALPGANVLIVETNKGAATNAEGQYRLESVPPGEYTLRVTFVGYRQATRTVEVNAGSTTRANFRLVPDYAQLEEVVVTGYGQREQQKLSASISTVESQDIASTVTTSPQEALQGTVAGVTVSSTAGAPGAGFQVRIRGATSVNASNQPLYVVDGVPVASGQFTDGFTGGQTVNNALSNIDLSNVESIEVLKDAAATAIYGTRASNGVVLIETKQGDPGRTQFNFSYSISGQSYKRDPELLTGEEMARIQREAWRNDCAALFGLSPGGCNPGFRDISESVLAGPGVIFDNGTPSPVDSAITTANHMEAIQQTGIQHDASLSVSGGQAGEGTTFRYLVSGNLRTEEGFLKKQGFNRLGGRTNLSYSWADNRANVTANVSYSQAETEVIENDNNIDGALTNALLAPTFEPTFDEDNPQGFNPAASAFDNPVAILDIKRDLVNTKFLGNVEFSYDFLSNLTGRVSGGLDRFDQDEDVFAPSYTREGSPRGSGEDDVFTYTNWKTDATLNYDETFADVHDFVAVGGLSFERTFRERVEVIGSDFPTNNLQTLSAAAELGGGSGSLRSTTGLQSFFGSIDYAYDNRYLLKLTARRDGSSRFGNEQQWGFFPAASGGWNIHEESFLDQSWINQLKLRASYGVTGQQNFGIGGSNMFSFPAQATFGAVDYAGDSGITPSGLPNSDLKWETTTQINLGLDFSFFQGRLSGTVDVYRKNTDDLLLNRPLPNTSGYNNFFQNVGSIRNEGLEFQLSTVNVQAENFEWRTTLNASTNRNEVTSLAEGVTVIDEGFASIVKEGEPLGAFRGWAVEGIFDNMSQICRDSSGDSCNQDGKFAYQEPGTTTGDFIFEDLNDDGVINSDDRKIIGNPFPDWSGGLTNTVEYRGFRLRAFLQYSLGRDVFNATDQFFGLPGFLFSTKANQLDRWTPANKDASEPRATFLDPNNNQRNSTHFVEDGSYARLKTLTLSYSLPQDLAQRTGLNNARIFVTGKNLLTFTGFNGLDPEINSFGQDNVVQAETFFAQPIPRLIQAGIEVGL